MEAVLYIAHGSRRDAANEKFVSFIEEACKHFEAPIQAFAFLEHAKPSVLQSIEAMVKKGAKRITIIPVFLLPGVHANQDIPALIDQAKKLYSTCLFYYGEPLGCDDVMVSILRERLEKCGFSGGEAEVVLLVGHGSREPAASDEFERLAGQLSEALNKETKVAYLTTAPFYEERVQEMLAKGISKVYILPFLLFSGGFTRKMEKNLEPVRERVVLCGSVGFDEKLIQLLQKRAAAARLLK